MSGNKNKFMLGKLFGSNSRVKILKLFLMHPERRYYIRQIARELKLQLNSVRRELENLETFGLLTSSNEFLNLENSQRIKKTSKREKENVNRSEKKYYQANIDFVLFEEIKLLIVKAKILYERDFIEKLQKIGRIKLLILTGFFINKINNSVDLFIVGRFNKVKLLRLVKELERELGREVNFALMDTKEFKYRRDITDVFLYEILEGEKIVVIDEMGTS